jgi:4-hydroxybenzoate polyprenyltransferase
MTLILDRRGEIHSCIQLVRPRHWAKNLLVFAPSILAHEWTNLDGWSAAGGAGLSLCLAASAGYVLNDLRDVESDRAHPEKCERPLACGAVTPAHAKLLAGALGLSAAIAAASVSPGVSLVVTLYMVGTIVYSTSLKREPVLDVAALAGLYLVRILAGAVATGTPLSSWFLGFSALFFFSLAVAKRHTELRRHEGSVQRSGRGYLDLDTRFTLAAGLASAFSATVVYLLYAALESHAAGYHSPGALSGIGAILALWLCRVWLLADRGALHYDPVEFAFRDRQSLFLGLAAASFFLIAL